MDELNLMLVIPEVFLAMTAMGFLLVGVFQGNRCTDVLCWSASFSFMIAAFILMRGSWDTSYMLGGMLVMDQFAGVMKLLIMLGLVFALALAPRYLAQERIARFEYPILIMFAGIGMLFMVSANNLLSLYMALELQSLSLYILAAFHRNSLRSAEAATKYFILGSLSSGMLLFGISLVYGFTGSLDFNVISESLSNLHAIPPGFTIGMVFILAALAFKISAVPFHMWTPDVYQGAPTSVTAFFAMVPKIAALGLLIRLLFVAFDGAQDQWVQILYFVSLSSLIVGAFAGIAQSNIMRLMAYSSIGNMGYALIGVITGTAQGVEAVIFFLLVYLVMTAGIFTIILSMRRGGMSLNKISDLAGLSKTRPFLAYGMAALMFSMAGIPPLAGFFSKMFIFEAAISEGLYVLATLGIIFSVVAAFYYLRIIKTMFFDEPEVIIDEDMGSSNRIVLLLSCLFIMGFVFFPSDIINMTTGAAFSLY